MQQNKIAVFRELSIENIGNDILSEVKVVLNFTPQFASLSSVQIELIKVDETVRVELPALKLDTTYLAQLTERLSGNICLQVFSREELICEESYPIAILAYDQWSGISVLPEMLSAFVTPNHPTILPIIKRAAFILEQWTGNPSLDEYQSRNPDRVQKQMAAIYAAIAEQEIIYSTIPASFEDYGQRIRLVDAVISQKLGTCLDMAVLYASCLEAVGIHSLVIFVKGHAFAGGWLTPETFPDNVIDDVSLLNKRIADGINDITLVETTGMNMGQNIDFDKSVSLASGRLIQPEFILAVDIKRSRFSGIKPIPQRVQNGSFWEIKEEEKRSVDQSRLKPRSVNPYDLSGISEEIEVTKQLLWERKLLDLSLRNNLLNVRITKNTLQLISAELDLLEDALANGEEFRIVHKPTDWDNPLFQFGLYQSISESDPIIDLVKSELSQKRLRSYLSENDLNKALTHLYRSSRTAMEENGANTLYVALGLLKWYETKASERPRYAPILLLPVEIIRKSAAKGYVIRPREEETMLNITLLEMLRQNFNISVPGLDPLPVDEFGVNVKLIYAIIRNSIKNQPRWDLEEQAILGLFSFNKFIMWNDIHNNANKLAENKVVSSLMNGRIEWEVDDLPTNARDLDRDLPPDKIVLPINADSSQLEAIWEASNGKNFILHGPPGTGKSQTITNLIANALYKDKRVLFVAEKMAALSVVQRRLEAIGLAPFCLELHSNKIKKGEVVSQLRQTSEIVKTIPPQNFKQEADRLFALRSEMNSYVDALHREYPFGFSLYTAIVRYQQIEEDILFDIPHSLLEGLDKNILYEWGEALELLVSTAKACGHPYGHPLSGIWIKEYSPSIKEEVSKNIEHMASLISNLKKQFDTLPDFFSDLGIYEAKEDADVIVQIIELLQIIPELRSALLLSPNLQELLDEYAEVCVHGENRDELRQKNLDVFSDNILQLDAKKTLVDWEQTSRKWFLPRFFGQHRVKKQLKPYAKTKLRKEEIPQLLGQIIGWQSEISFVAKYEEQLPIHFGRFGRKDYEDWDSIGRILSDVATINALILKQTKDIVKASEIKKSLSLKLSEGVDSFRSMYGNALIEIVNLNKELQQQESLLFASFGVKKEVLYPHSESWVDVSLKQLNLWNANLDKMKDWYQWLNVHKRMTSLKIDFIADAYKEQNIETSRLLDIFNKSLYKSAIDYILSKESDLDLFKGEMFNDTIEKYRKLAADFERLTQQELFAKLASHLPSFTREATHNSEVGILQRNIRNNARGISIRRLFDLIPTLLPRMCPCMLMSPISVAQYIDVDAEKFDLVVFDEASQMPTYEAVGAIARGANVVIVGDPKQMPPTNFFSVNVVDEDNIEMEDLESILDDCLALSMPSKHLLWHYRSRHESLIAFSNSEYYENKLLTFPSPDNIESKVRFVSVEGCYDKGKSRQNKAEAQAIVDEIIRRLKDDELRQRSIGVVTFSIVQQTLIEDMLSNVFIYDHELEKLALEGDEPLFVKNLENVQGDERDVILFSVGYGPDKDGKVSMNFGPLNRLGGERRLNVAVSRARYEMVIFSTLRSDQIDLNRTSAVGVAGLKRFLEYAEQGKNLIKNSQNLSSFKDSINHLIATELEKMGYEVHTEIGCSGYKIDIGIVDKDNPKKYKLGVVCDGESYSQAKMVRDREIVQFSVLKSLGWKICKVWTLDWLEDPNKVLRKIEESLLSSDNGEEVRDYMESKNGLEIEKPLSLSPTDFYLAYKSTELEPIVQTSEDFFNHQYKKIILNQIKEIISKEAPVSRTLLCKRVISAWGITRMGQRLERYFDAILDNVGIYKSKSDVMIFYWQNEEQYQNYDLFRVGGRDAIDLPPEEVANAMKYILKNEISLPITDLSKACAQLFGFARSGSNVDASMNRGILKAEKKGFLKINGDRATIV